MDMNVRKAEKADLKHVAEIYKNCFPREENHDEWINACFRSYPKGVYYVIEINGNIVGYILWCVKNGFRSNAIIELEQVGIHSGYSGRGFGKALISQSHQLFQELINSLGYAVGAIIVTTSEGNYAEGLYQSALGVQRACKIEGYGSGNELILYKKLS